MLKQLDYNNFPCDLHFNILVKKPVKNFKKKNDTTENISMYIKGITVWMKS